MARSLLLLLPLLILNMAALTCAYDFYVGGRDGWMLNPRESYNSWAGKWRFQVNDKLVFIYKKGEDSVLQVTKEAYDSCNSTKPIRKMDGGSSTFQLDRSGPFYFISGARGRCEQGQKLHVVVLSMRHRTPSSTVPPALSPRQPIAPAPGPASSTAPTPEPSPAISPAPTSPGGSGGVVPPSGGPGSAPEGPAGGPGTPASPGSASSGLSVSRVSLTVAGLVLGVVFIS